MFTFQNQIWIPDSKGLVLLSSASLAFSRMPSPHWLGMVSCGCSNKWLQTWRLTQITLSPFWRPEFQTQEIAGPPPSQDLRKDSIPCLFPLQGPPACLGVPWLVTPQQWRLQSFHLHVAFIGFRSHPGNPGWSQDPLLNYICNDPFSK